MKRIHYIISVVLFFCFVAVLPVASQTVKRYLLDTVDSGSGSWPCLYYELNYNSDLKVAEDAGWSALEEDESYWCEGFGPFSIDENKFYVTEWGSTVHPILIRRHLVLTAEDMENIMSGTLTLTYSYDENPRFWINGKAVTSATGWNDNNYASTKLRDAKKSYLHEGDNVVCVSLHQGEGGGHIDYGLVLEYTPSESGIAEVDLAHQDEAKAYNLLGQRIAANSADIYVTNGKKIIRTIQ